MHPNLRFAFFFLDKNADFDFCTPAMAFRCIHIFLKDHLS